MTNSEQQELDAHRSEIIADMNSLVEKYGKSSVGIFRRLTSKSQIGSFWRRCTELWTICQRNWQIKCQICDTVFLLSG